MTVDKSELARLLLRWEAVKRNLDEIEQAIEDAVMELGQTQQAGNVRATYSAGRKAYDYQAVGADAPDTLVAKYTETITKTDWREVALEGMQIKQDAIPFTQSAPSVTVKLV